MKRAAPTFLLLLWMGTAHAQNDPSNSSSNDKAVLSGEKIRVEAVIAAGKLSKRYLAKVDDRWVEMATAEGLAADPEIDHVGVTYQEKFRNNNILRARR
jgi:hypothetical protein